ncbi:hypothetical protein RUM43_000552, partial [Polyplax serrata]
MHLLGDTELERHFMILVPENPSKHQVKMPARVSGDSSKVAFRPNRGEKKNKYKKNSTKRVVDFELRIKIT